MHDDHPCAHSQSQVSSTNSRAGHRAETRQTPKFERAPPSPPSLLWFPPPLLWFPPPPFGFLPLGVPKPLFSVPKPPFWVPKPFWVLPPAFGFGPPGLHTTTREIQTCTFQTPALQTPPKFHEKTQKKRNGGGRVKKKREILGPHPSRPHPSGPHLSGPHLSGPRTPKVYSSKFFFHPFWPNSGLAKVGQIRMAKVGLAKVGISRGPTPPFFGEERGRGGGRVPRQLGGFGPPDLLRSVGGEGGPSPLFTVRLASFFFWGGGEGGRRVRPTLVGRSLSLSFLGGEGVRPPPFWEGSVVRSLRGGGGGGGSVAPSLWGGRCPQSHPPFGRLVSSPPPVSGRGRCPAPSPLGRGPYPAPLPLPSPLAGGRCWGSVSLPPLPLHRGIGVQPLPSSPFGCVPLARVGVPPPPSPPPPPTLWEEGEGRRSVSLPLPFGCRGPFPSPLSQVGVSSPLLLVESGCPSLSFWVGRSGGEEGGEERGVPAPLLGGRGDSTSPAYLKMSCHFFANEMKMNATVNNAHATHMAVRGKWRQAATTSCNEGRSPSEPPAARRSSKERAKGATGSTSQHRAPPVVVGMAHAVAEDPRDRPSFGLGQLTHEIDSFQRPTATNLSSQHNETSPATCTRELRVR